MYGSVWNMTKQDLFYLEVVVIIFLSCLSLLRKFYTFVVFKFYNLVLTLLLRKNINNRLYFLILLHKFKLSGVILKAMTLIQKCDIRLQKKRTCDNIIL